MKEVYDSWVSLAQEPQKDLSERREELTKKKKNLMLRIKTVIGRILCPPASLHFCTGIVST